MLKNISRLEFIIGEKVYHFVCDQDSPLDNCKEALFQFTKFIGQIQDQMKAAADELEKKKSEEQKNIENPIEEKIEPVEAN